MNEEMIRITARLASCPHLASCRKLCTSMDQTSLPAPDYVGPNYRGLVIIGANPGIPNSHYFRAHDEMREQYLSRLGETPSARNYNNLMAFLADYMSAWKNNLSNAEFREILGYDIKEVAYLNLVKCRTQPTGSDVRKTVGDVVAERCWREYAVKQLKILKPKYIVGHWQPIRATLIWLGYDLRGIEFAAYSGARHLSYAERSKDVKPLFDRFAKDAC